MEVSHPSYERSTRSRTDDAAIRYAKLALGEHATGHFDDPNITSWADFTKRLQDTFLPQHLDLQLTIELQNVRMMNNNNYPQHEQCFNLYKAQVHGHKDMDPKALLANFVNGLEPYIRVKVLEHDPKSFDDAKRLAARAYHLGTPVSIPWPPNPCRYNNFLRPSHNPWDHTKSRSTSPHDCNKLHNPEKPTGGEKGTSSPATQAPRPNPVRRV
jgi:hypothetical protein